jgi:hypothetical protein
MKTGKEIKNNNFKNYNITYGTVNNKNPKSIYLNISSWVEPIKDETNNYSFDIRTLNKKIKQTLFNYLDANKTIFNKDRTIVDLDIRESGIKLGKRSFMNCEVTFFMKEALSINSIEITNTIDELTDLMFATFETNKSFKFHKKKN